MRKKRTGNQVLVQGKSRSVQMCAGAWPHLGSSAVPWEEAVSPYSPRDLQTHSLLTAFWVPGLLRSRGLPPELQAI